MRPFIAIHPTSWVLIPTISLSESECPCCGKPRVELEFSFLAWTLGLSFSSSH